MKLSACLVCAIILPALALNLEVFCGKMACWRETNDKEITKSIPDAEARISDLANKVEELTANCARLNTEIKNLEKEVTENQSALDKA